MLDVHQFLLLSARFLLSCVNVLVMLYLALALTHLFHALLLVKKRREK